MERFADRPIFAPVATCSHTDSIEMDLASFPSRVFSSEKTIPEPSSSNMGILHTDTHLEGEKSFPLSRFSFFLIFSSKVSSFIYHHLANAVVFLKILNKKDIKLRAQKTNDTGESNQKQDGLCTYVFIQSI